VYPRWHAIGAHLGPYTIRRQIEAGGMGEVYLAHDTRLGLKVCPPRAHLLAGRRIAAREPSAKSGISFESHKPLTNR
jgi:serine/threonine protein kinase